MGSSRWGWHGLGRSSDVRVGGRLVEHQAEPHVLPMSRAALIQQLSSSAGEQFTKAQATQAADAVLR
jgi:hypothetical protein